MAPTDWEDIEDDGFCTPSEYLTTLPVSEAHEEPDAADCD